MPYNNGNVHPQITHILQYNEYVLPLVMKLAGMLHLNIDGHGRPLWKYNQQIHDCDVVQTQIQNHFFLPYSISSPLEHNKKRFIKHMLETIRRFLTTNLWKKGLKRGKPES